VAFDFDTGNPIDTFLIPNYPQNERDFRVDVKAMLEIEHDTVEGRHKTGIGTDSARNTITTWVVGSTWYSTQGGGDVYLQVCVSVGPPVWHNVDARGGGIDSALDDVAHINEKTLYTVTQWADIFTISLTGGGPGKLCAVNFNESPAQYALIDDDTLISNPANVLSTFNTSTIQLELKMDGSGGHEITFGTAYRAPGGIDPIFDAAADAITVFFITQLRDGNFLITSSPGVAALP